MINRTVPAHQLFTGISRQHPGCPVEELVEPWPVAADAEPFVSGKKKQHTTEATIVADHQGRTLRTDALRPGRIHGATAARNEGIAVCSQHFPEVDVLLDDGHLGLGRDHPGQAITPPRKPNRIAFPHVHAAKGRPGTNTRRSASPSSTRSPTTNAGSG